MTTIYDEVGMLSERQLKRLSAIRVDYAAQELRLSIHHYDMMAFDAGGWAILAKTHAGSDEERFAWLRGGNQ